MLQIHFHLSVISLSGMFKWNVFEEESPKVIAVPPSIHEQADGTVLGMCITGTSSKDSLTTWIRLLEKTNPKLPQIPVIFRLRTPEHELAVVNDEVPPSSELTGT